MKKLLVVLTILVSSNAHAWGNVGIPDPVTWVLHAVGGYVIARIMDKHTSTPDDVGVATATIIGAAKEVSDLNFSGPDFISWTVGAWFYHRTKNMVRCPDRDDIIVYYVDKLEECAK